MAPRCSGARRSRGRRRLLLALGLLALTGLGFGALVLMTRVLYIEPMLARQFDRLVDPAPSDWRLVGARSRDMAVLAKSPRIERVYATDGAPRQACEVVEQLFREWGAELRVPGALADEVREGGIIFPDDPGLDGLGRPFPRRVCAVHGDRPSVFASRGSYPVSARVFTPDDFGVFDARPGSRAWPLDRPLEQGETAVITITLALRGDPTPVVYPSPPADDD
jgi:hypothetical protein